MASDDLTRRLPQAQQATHADVRSAWVASVQSVVWTLASGLAAVVIGLTVGSAVLVAFGAVGSIDAVGSAALAYHFRHGLRHDEMSDHLERLAHRFVSLGLVMVGLGAVAGGGLRLLGGHESEQSAIGTGLAAASLVVLVALARRKRSLAARVSSRALLGDSHLSAVGATQAAVTLLGRLTAMIGWHWTDPAAAVAVGIVTTAVGVKTSRAEVQTRRRWSRRSLVPVAFAAVSTIAVVDALLGERLILVGLLVLGPACAAASGQLRATAAASVTAVALAVGLGIPDKMWLTTEHLIWVATVTLVAVTTTALLASSGSRLPVEQSQVGT